MVRFRLAIDPGDVHVGWASCFRIGDGDVRLTGEWTPTECIDMTRLKLAPVRAEAELIVEEFVLYPGKSKEQAGSSFKTSQLIGALKLVAHDLGVPVVMQSATIKNPTRRQLKARGIEQLATGSGIHASDAELHLWYRILRQQREEAT